MYYFSDFFVAIMDGRIQEFYPNTAYERVTPEVIEFAELAGIKVKNAKLELEKAKLEEKRYNAEIAAKNAKKLRHNFYNVVDDDLSTSYYSTGEVYNIYDHVTIDHGVDKIYIRTKDGKYGCRVDIHPILLGHKNFDYIVEDAIRRLIRQQQNERAKELANTIANNPVDLDFIRSKLNG